MGKRSEETEKKTRIRTYEERARKFEVARSTIWNALRKPGIRRKKKRRRYQEQNEQEQKSDPDQGAKREKAKRVSLDECGIEQRRTRESGWIERGQALRGRITGNRQKRINVIAAYRQGKILAPRLYEGTMTPPFFTPDLKTCLVPELHGGEVVMMENASFHKSPRVKAFLAETGGSRLFLPASSPDLNPIEPVWAAVKSPVRKTRSQFSSLLETLCHLFSSHPRVS